MSHDHLQKLQQGKAPIEATKPRVVYSPTHHEGRVNAGGLHVLVGRSELHDLYHRNEAALVGTPRSQADVDVGNSARAAGALPCPAVCARLSVMEQVLNPVALAD